MKIVHICLGCFFPDNYSYQENLLPKFHKQLGYDVSVIASLMTFDKYGKTSYIEKASSYINEYGIPVTRLEYKSPNKIYKKLKRYTGTFEALKREKPDILFIHGCQFMDIDKVVAYINTRNDITVYVDNHADFSNSATNFLSKNVLHKILWRNAARKIEPYTKKFYGVLPARVDFLINIYKLPKEKCELLVMGADDDKIEEAVEEDSRNKIRTQYGVAEDDFLIMFGGKIDAWKTQILLLMQAVRELDISNVKLIIFGSVTQELKGKVESLCEAGKIEYIGWIKAEDSYHYWSAADLAVFPGRHSVFWEQVAGMGIPMICKYWDGTTHIDIGGNVKFLKEDSVEEIKRTLSEVIEKEYVKMKEVAQGVGKNTFSYKDIALRAIEQKR